MQVRVINTRGSKRSGFTLIELSIVLVILGILAGIALPFIGDGVENAKSDATKVTLQNLRKIIMGDAQNGGGYFADNGSALALTATLQDLFIQDDQPDWDIHAEQGWRGPYIATATGRYKIDNAKGFTADYGADDDSAVNDAFGNPIVLQIPNTTDSEIDRLLNVRLVSAGLNGKIDCPLDKLSPRDLTLEDRDDDLVVFLRVADDVETEE